MSYYHLGVYWLVFLRQVYQEFFGTVNQQLYILAIFPPNPVRGGFFPVYLAASGCHSEKAGSEGRSAEELSAKGMSSAL